MIDQPLIINLLFILSVAWALGGLCIRIGLPVMIGELVAGLILGPPLLGIIHFTPTLEFLADLGIFFAMFYAGMEMNPRELMEHVWPSLSVAAGGFLLPFTMGYFAVRYFEGTVYQSLFIGMGLSVTAIAVGAVILQDMRIHKSTVGHIIMGAAIASDILALVTLSVLLGIVQTGSIQFQSIFFVMSKVVLFFGVSISVGHFILPYFTKRLEDVGGKGFTFALVSALVMAYMAELAGLHLVIGAFLAGQFVRKEIMREDIYKVIKDRFFGISYGFLTPIFFASLAFHLHLQVSSQFIIFSLVITTVAFAGKFLGSAIGAKAFGKGLRESFVIGFGMNGRGAVELVIASVVIKLSHDLMSKGIIHAPLLTQDQFSALVLMAFLTTLITPVLLKWSVTKACTKEEKAGFCRLWEDGKREKF